MLELPEEEFIDYDLWGKEYKEYTARNASIEQFRKCGCGCGERCLEGGYYIKGHSPKVIPGSRNVPHPNARGPRPHLRGKNSHRWKGGVSFSPYCEKFNYEFKESIRKKFRRSCFLCGKTELENGRRLDIHHVDYQKDCLCDGIECEFVPLCTNCHSEIHNDRGKQDWEKTFIEMLIKQKKNRK